jgi:hypothetical protein
LQDKLVGDQPLTPERAEEIAKTMDRTGCAARLPPTDAGVPHPRVAMPLLLIWAARQCNGRLEITKQN